MRFFQVLALVVAFLAACQCPPGVVPTPENMCVSAVAGSGTGDGGPAPVDAGPPVYTGGIRLGDLVQRVPGPPEMFPDGTNRSTIFQVVEGGVLRPFLDVRTFHSWHPYSGTTTFSAVRRDWTDTQFAAFRIGRPMVYRPGTWIVSPLPEVGADHAYYLVENCGALRPVSEAQLEQLYGSRWRTGDRTMYALASADLRQNVSLQSWPHYRVGPPINSPPMESYPFGQLLLLYPGYDTLAVSYGNSSYRLVDAAGEVANRFDRTFAVRVPVGIRMQMRPVGPIVTRYERDFHPCPE